MYDLHLPLKNNQLLVNIPFIECLRMGMDMQWWVLMVLKMYSVDFSEAAEKACTSSAG